MAGSSGLLFGNQGNDTISATSTAATVWGGLGNDSLLVGGGAPQTVFGNKGNDTVDGTGSNPITIVGGNDSADGSDGLLGGASTDLAFGNDTVNSGDGNDTLVGGQGGDSLFASGTGNNLVFANEGNDSVNVLAGNDTVFAGLGNDTIIGGNGWKASWATKAAIRSAAATASIRSRAAPATTYSPMGRQRRTATMPPAAARWSSSRTWISRSIDSRLRRRSPSPPTRAGTVVDLNASANNALNAAAALAGVQTVAAQFTFGGCTYLAINLVNAVFLDSDDLLIDITGFTGSIGNGNFV